jgi:hypothetical protein
MNIALFAKKHISPSIRERLTPVAKVIYRNDLNTLALMFRTDKWGGHWYTQHYQRFFKPFKKAKINLLEIGVGGGDNTTKGGESLRMWKAFFPKARIVGIDIEDKTHFQEPRIDIRICDQTDAATLRKLSDEYGGFDIIIDDGSHINEHVIQSFVALFPLLRTNGLYAIEDTQTSYWPSFGGGTGGPQTLMSFFKNLTDGLNHVEYAVTDYSPDYFDKNIIEMTFFHNLIIIRKGANDEKSCPPGQVEQEISKAL